MSGSWSRFHGSAWKDAVKVTDKTVTDSNGRRENLRGLGWRYILDETSARKQFREALLADIKHHEDRIAEDRVLLYRPPEAPVPPA